jgi:hypothetical protein
MLLELTNELGRKRRSQALPHLLLPGSPFGLPDVLHSDALKAAKHYGAFEGPLARSSQTS